MNSTNTGRFAVLCLLVIAATPWHAAGKNVQADVERLAAGEAMTIEECVGIASELNPSLRATEMGAEATDRAVLEAYSVYLPSVNSSLDRSRRRGKDTDQFGTTSESEFDNFSSGINVRQNFFNYSGYRGITGARKSREASWAGFEASRQDLILQVKQAYHTVLKMEDLLEVSNENLRVGEEQLKLAEKRKEVGAGVIADVLKARAQVESNRLGVITSEKNLATSRAELLSSIGLRVTLPIVLREPEAVAPSLPDFNSGLEIAYEKRPDLQQWDLSLQASRDRIGQARGEWIPTVTGNFTYGWQSTTRPDFDLDTTTGAIVPAGDRTDTGKGWTASVSMNIPILNGGTISRIRQNQARAEEAQWNLENIRQTIALEVQEAILSIEENMKKMDVAERNISAAEEDLRVSQGKYQHGLVPILDLIESQVALATAKAEGVEAYYNYLSSEAAYANAIGLAE